MTTAPISAGPATAPLHLLASMATRGLLTDLLAALQIAQPGLAARLESVGGVDAARRVDAGEAIDLVVLSAESIGRLVATGRLRADGMRALVQSGVAAAVRAGAPRPDIGSEDALRRAVRAAPRIGHSTGPSGVALLSLFARWGLDTELQGRIVQAPPGVPVGTLLARGEVDLGFQQLSELMHLPGIDLLGPLPAAVQITTTFSAGLGTTLTGERLQAARALLDGMTSSAAAPIARSHGMDPA